MPLLDLTRLIALHPRDGRLLGLDVGTKTIGLALSDLTLTVATPRSTIIRAKFSNDIKILFDLIDKNDVFGLVIGLPISMDGSEGPRCQSIRQFAANLEHNRPLAMTLWDERLSTVAVTRVLLEADSSRRRRAQVVDKMAAAYILQGALDAAAYAAR